MNRPVPSRVQRGATLVIGLIMLVVITLMVISAFTLSSTNLKSVGNMQIRNEAIAAANAAIETVLSTSLAPTSITVSIGGIDYGVTVAISPCLSASIADLGTKSSVSIVDEFGKPILSKSDYWNVVRDIEATVTDANSGAKVVVHQGARVLVSEADKTTLCP